MHFCFFLERSGAPFLSEVFFRPRSRSKTQTVMFLGGEASYRLENRILGNDFGRRSCLYPLLLGQIFKKSSSSKKHVRRQLFFRRRLFFFGVGILFFGIEFVFFYVLVLQILVHNNFVLLLLLLHLLVSVLDHQFLHMTINQYILLLQLQEILEF